MKIPPTCGICKTEMEELCKQARLDQCCGTYLPAISYICPKCPEPVVTTLATGETCKCLPSCLAGPQV